MQEGRPYRDFQVEYLPVTLAAIEVVGDADARAAGTRLLWLGLVADAVIAGSLLCGWGKRAGVAYLALSVPVLGIIYQTMDALPAALGCLGIALASGSGNARAA